MVTFRFSEPCHPEAFFFFLGFVFVFFFLAYPPPFVSLSVTRFDLLLSLFHCTTFFGLFFFLILGRSDWVPLFPLIFFFFLGPVFD